MDTLVIIQFSFAIYLRSKHARAISERKVEILKAAFAFAFEVTANCLGMNKSTKRLHFRIVKIFCSNFLS